MPTVSFAKVSANSAEVLTNNIRQTISVRAIS
jgi:hypothetical protein